MRVGTHPGSTAWLVVPSHRVAHASARAVTHSFRPAPVRQYLPELIDLVWEREINPGKVSDLTQPLNRSADAYQAMDERRAITVLLSP